VVDPWGTVVAECGGEGREDGEGEFCLADIDLDKVESTRKCTSSTTITNTVIPLWEQRRTDVYPVI
jgi:predicted amidohydrolase